MRGRTTNTVVGVGERPNEEAAASGAIDNQTPWNRRRVEQREHADGIYVEPHPLVNRTAVLGRSSGDRGDVLRMRELGLIRQQGAGRCVLCERSPNQARVERQVPLRDHGALDERAAIPGWGLHDEGKM